MQAYATDFLLGKGHDLDRDHASTMDGALCTMPPAFRRSVVLLVSASGEADPRWICSQLLTVAEAVMRKTSGRRRHPGACLLARALEVNTLDLEGEELEAAHRQVCRDLDALQERCGFDDRGVQALSIAAHAVMQRELQGPTNVYINATDILAAWTQAASRDPATLEREADAFEVSLVRELIGAPRRQPTADRATQAPRDARAAIGGAHG